MNEDDFEDYYALLKVDADASKDEIERAYRFEMRYWHPDNYASKTKDYQQEAEKVAIRLNQALEILKDDQRRILYDELYAEWKATQRSMVPVKGGRMAYQAEISRTNPSCFLFLIDQSGSMSDNFGGESETSKAEQLATIINRLFQMLVIKCSKDEGVRDYFDVGVIGYGDKVGAALGGALAGQVLVRISQIADNPLRIEDRTQKISDGAGGLIQQTVKFPIWFDPQADGGTPMRQALRLAHSSLRDWVAAHPDSFPPIVFNISDGEATDGDPAEEAGSIRRLATTDGDVLLFNIHVSSLAGKALEFPDNEEGLPDDFAVRLFRMASQLPPHIQDAARGEGYKVSESTRGFVFNADAVAVIQFLDIGTRPANLR